MLEALNLRMSWASRKRLQMDLEAFNLTVPQYMTLRCVYNKEEGCSMSELAESSHQLSATMTGIVDRLEDRGLVERRRDPNDRRAQIVGLTPQGKALMEQANAAKRRVTMQGLSLLTPEERRAMIETTQHYLEILETLSSSS